MVSLSQFCRGKRREAGFQDIVEVIVVARFRAIWDAQFIQLLEPWLHELLELGYGVVRSEERVHFEGVFVRAGQPYPEIRVGACICEPGEVFKVCSEGGPEDIYAHAGTC